MKWFRNIHKMGVDMTDEQAKKMLLGEWIAISGTVWVVIAIAIFMLCGCEDGGDTVYESPDVIVGSNSQVIVVNDNSGLVSVDQTTGGDSDPSIYVSGNTGRVYVVARPEPPVEEEDEE